MANIYLGRSLSAWLGTAATVGLCAIAPTAVQPAMAQSAPVVSRPVVQSLPSAQSQRLNAALARIGRDPRDVGALVDAGDVANAMGDPEAAAGFYRRAGDIDAYDPRIKAGLARALVLQGDPVKAIPLFAQAEAAGTSADVTADRGLAYDLVGDTTTAQKYYRVALARRDDDEVRRRLGISLAIAGDAAGSEAMLMPLLRKQDKPGWRAHAFALAIAGRVPEAVTTVNAILPGQLAQSVTPYLRYMPRLTRAQQAAAANLGKFPRASEIGRDDPAIAAFAPSSTLAGADAALIPQGKALGSGKSRNARAELASADTGSGSRRRAREQVAQQLARAKAEKADRVAPPDPAPAIGRDTSGELPPIGSVATPPQQLAVAAQATEPARTVPDRAPEPTPASTPQPRPAAASPGLQTRLASVPVREPVRTTETAPALASASRFDLARVSGATSVSRPSAAASQGVSAPQPAQPAPQSVPAQPSAAPSPAPSPTPPAGAQSEAEPTPASPTPVSLAFADLGTPNRVADPISGAVDVRAIEAVKAEPKPEPEEVLAVKKVEAKVAEAKAAPKPATKAGADKKAAGKLATEASDAKAADAKKRGKLTAEDTAAATTKRGKLAAEDDTAATTAKRGAKGSAAKSDTDAAKGAKGKKAPPSHPSRIWVQVGVGRDKSAIAYDWKRNVKQSPTAFKGRQANVSEMGRTNRILVGPFESQKAANAYLAQVKKADIGNAFVWTSPAGQVVDTLPTE